MRIKEFPVLEILNLKPSLNDKFFIFQSFQELIFSNKSSKDFSSLLVEIIISLDEIKLWFSDFLFETDDVFEFILSSFVSLVFFHLFFGSTTFKISSDDKKTGLYSILLPFGFFKYKSIK
ncbi:TPA: hypothetical protein DEG21_04525 [Patescibacteria group bacterium]|nr:hypothetical protein [Candidatus Gracilibacteria bacterium]HBY75101.1 hypothetical protein [Candidatus Gracilibacteria bacterium]